ncbi:MAG: restriction endonuclease subunit S [Lamprocystis purpurea]|jgi:type I restriction enzyme S subunit|nr:restriction endonuclease subunit S [Lamprocystis purpurea]
MLTHRYKTILGDIPDDWQAKPIRELIAEQFAGDWGDDDGEIAVPVIRSTNFTNNGNLDMSNVATRYFPKQKADQSGLKCGDLLVERSGGGPDQPVGRIGFITNDMPGAMVSNFVQVLRPDPKKVAPAFLGWVLFELQRTGIIERVQQQSTQMRNLNWREYQRLLLPSPDQNEQSPIVGAIKLADNAISTARVALDATRDLKRSLMTEVFTRGIRSKVRKTQETKLGLIPIDWTTAELRSIWKSSTNGIYVPENQYGSGIPIIRIDTFSDGFFDTREFKRIRVDKADVTAFSLEAGDLLVNRVNSIPFLGKVVYVDRMDEFCVFESNMMRLRFGTAEIAQYLSLYLSVPSVKKRIWAMGRPAVAQLSINQRDIGKFLIALPGPEERREILDVMFAARTAEIKAAEKLAALYEVKKSLLHNLLTGKIRIPADAPLPDRGAA